MSELISMSLRWKDDSLMVLDQTKLPVTEDWREITHPDEMADAILKLQVRGAPLIGVAAALSLAQYVRAGASEKDFVEAAARLRAARPTAVNLMYAIDLMVTELEGRFDAGLALELATGIFLEDQELCMGIARNGEHLLADGDGVLTHCNTGGLATVGYGTALGIVRRAHESGKRLHVYVDETRPLLQGGRLTTWELKKLGIPFTLICDNMAATLMAQGRIQKAIVGSDRIACNGDFANKVGTYSVAVNCHYHRIPFIVAAPYTTVDLNCASGSQIPIEERSQDEVTRISGIRDVDVYNPAFDVTPAQLVSHWVLDKGCFDKQQIERGALEGEK